MKVFKIIIYALNIICYVLFCSVCARCTLDYFNDPNPKKEWKNFKKENQCVLKEKDNSGFFGTTYTWQCSDGMIYKNKFNERENEND